MNNSISDTRDNDQTTSKSEETTKESTVTATDRNHNSIGEDVITNPTQEHPHPDNECGVACVEEADKLNQLFSALAGTSEREARVLVTAAIKAVLITFAGENSATQLAYLYNWVHGMATVLQEDISPKMGLEGADGLSLFDRLWAMIQLEPDPAKRLAGAVGCLTALGLEPEAFRLLQSHAKLKADEHTTARTASEIEGRTISSQEKDLADKVLRLCADHPAKGNETLNALFGAFHAYLHNSPYPIPKKLEYVLRKLLGLYDGYKSATIQVQRQDGVTFEVTRGQKDDNRGA